VAMKLRDKARSLEDEVNDGRKHCWPVADQGLAKIYNSSFCSRLCSFPLLSWLLCTRQLIPPFSNSFCVGIPATLLSLYLKWLSICRPPWSPYPTPAMPTASLVSTPSLLTIPPFYEPGAPPPTLPILIAQTEVGNIERPDKLLAQEDLGTGPARNHTSNSSHRFSPYPKAASRRQSSKHSRPSTPKHRDRTPCTESDGESESDSSDSATSEDHLIPKPDGEAGRPGRGGYNLEEALGWEHRKYCRVKVWDYSNY
jgi:hypothetical protein